MDVNHHILSHLPTVETNAYGDPILRITREQLLKLHIQSYPGDNYGERLVDAISEYVLDQIRNKL